MFYQLYSIYVSLLGEAPAWLADDSFKFTHEMFYQLYSIYVSLLGEAPACLYAFLPNKLEKKHIIVSKKPPKKLTPDKKHEKFLLDFQQAALRAFQKNFPESKLSGCFFIFLKTI